MHSKNAINSGNIIIGEHSIIFFLIFNSPSTAPLLYILYKRVEAVKFVIFIYGFFLVTIQVHVPYPQEVNIFIHQPPN